MTIAKVLTTLISLVSTMLLSRFRTLGEYGTYSQLLIVITLFTSIVMMGLPNSTNYFLARAENSNQKSKFLSIYYTLNTLLCFVMGILLLVFIPIFEKYFANDTIGEYWFFLLFYPWAYVSISGISNVLVVYGKTVKLVEINIINALVALISILIVQFIGLSFREYLIFFLIGNLIITAYIYLVVFKLEKGIKFSFNWEYIKEIFVYSIPLGLASIVGTINIEIDKLMIGNLMDTESLAIYTNASRVLPLTMVSASLTAVVLPYMARRIKDNDYKSAVKVWGDTFELSFIFMAFFSMTLIAYAPQIMTLLYSEKYLPGVNVFIVYALVLLTRTTYWGMALSALGKTKLIFWCSIGSLLLNAILNYFFYFMFGMIGPAIASFVSIFLMLVLQLVLSSKWLSVRLKDFFPWKNVFLVLLTNVILGAVSKTVLYVFNIGVSASSIIYAMCVGVIVLFIYAIIFKNRVKILWDRLNSEKI